MPQAQEFDLESAFDEFASASDLASAGAFNTVPTGEYHVQVTGAKGRKYDDRPVASLTVSILNESGKKVATAFDDISWKMGRNPWDGKPDSKIKKWDQITKALYPTLKADERSKKDVPSVLKDMMAYPLAAYVQLKFKVGEKWVTARTPEEAKEHSESGAQAKNVVYSYRAIR